MPKAKPFPDSEEEEKTTIESQWEDEASTTVEQGDVAEKIRELGVNPKGNRTGITNTGAVDEPTVDDQHAQMSAITPVRDIARLVITQGNDAGQEVEIRPGKPYTIGRAIDNDVVLTDIAVSRKHFDLRFEDGAWVIVDRGSGNGTVVNGNLEDNPFMLANGDVIEIGNTVFKFDQPNAAPRPQRTMELESDEEELSTVAGKPVRADNIDELHQPLGKMPARPPRPKTLPPPTPLRTASSTQPPPLGFPPPGPPLPASTLPLPQMANRPPIGTPHSPSMLGDPNMMAAASAANGLPVGPSGLPTTIPGQGMPQRPPIYSYPQASEIPPHSVHAQMLLIQTQNRRGDGSTAHVPPTPYDGMPAAPQRYSQPQLTRRAKLTLAGIGLAVFAAVMTVAIVKSGSKPVAATTEPGKSDAKGTPKTEVAKTAEPTSPTDTKATVTPIDTKSATPTTTTPTTTTPTTVAAKDVKPPTTPSTTTSPPAPTVTTPAKTEPAKTTPTVAKTETKSESKNTTKFTPPKRPPTREKREARPPPQPKVEKVEKTETPPPQKRVASADPDTAKTQADNLYRAKKFNEASAVLAKAAGKVDEDDAKELRRTSDMYAKLGRAFAQGTAPATRPTEAFEALRQAQNYDRNVGNAFDGEITQKLAQVAPKAAISYMANHNYPQARSAVLVAQQFGSSDSVKLVLSKLESAAGELYSEAIKEQETNPIGAKDKLRQIKLFADPKSPWYQKASKALSGG